MTFNPQIHHRKSIRLKGYDYSKAGLYFITLCVQDKYHLFGEIIEKKMILNQLGQIAHNEWLNSTNIRDNITLHEFIIMPNHFHCILEINLKKSNDNQSIGTFKSPSQTIGSLLRGYKITTTKKIKDYIKEEKIRTGELQFAPNALIGDPTKKIWQRNYFEKIIRDEEAYHNISNYIRNNPAKWHKDQFSK